MTETALFNDFDDILTEAKRFDIVPETESDMTALGTPEIQNLLLSIRRLENTNEVLTENMTNAMLALQVENIGWTGVIGGNGTVNDNGIDLQQLQEISERCRTHGAFTDLIKRGLGLRASYIWSKGILIEGTESVKGRPRAVSNFMKRNESFLTDAESQQELERLAGTDGNVLFVVPKINHSSAMMVLGASDIDQVALNPNKDDDIWAYRRVWMQTNVLTGESVQKKEWIITDRWDVDIQKVPENIGSGPTAVPVSKSHVIVDVRVNRQKGWALGIPDVAPGLPYYREYNNFMKYGSDVAASMSKIVFKVLNKSAAGAAQAAVQMNKPGQGGGSVALGDGQDFQALNTAGRGYDFDSGRSLAARLAASLEVSVIHLLSDPGAAGSSYGSAQNLDLPTKRAMVLRQRTWEDAFRRIFKAIAPNEDIKIQFPPLEDPDLYREAQTRTMDWLTGLFEADEMRDRIVDETRMKVLHDGPPENVLLPNNSDSWQRADIDPSEDPGTDSSKTNSGEARTEASSPDQGKNTGTGNSGYNDKRSDVLAQSLVSAQMTALEEKLNEVLFQLSANNK